MMSAEATFDVKNHATSVPDAAGCASVAGDKPFTVVVDHSKHRPRLEPCFGSIRPGGFFVVENATDAGVNFLFDTAAMWRMLSEGSVRSITATVRMLVVEKSLASADATQSEMGWRRQAHALLQKRSAAHRRVLLDSPRAGDCEDATDERVIAITGGQRTSCQEAIEELTCSHGGVSDFCRRSCETCDKPKLRGPNDEAEADVGGDAPQDGIDEAAAAAAAAADPRLGVFSGIHDTLMDHGKRMIGVGASASRLQNRAATRILLLGADGTDLCVLAGVLFTASQIIVAGPIQRNSECEPAVRSFGKRISFIDVGWHAVAQRVRAIREPFDAVIHMGNNHFAGAAESSDTPAATEVLDETIARVRDGGWFVSLNPGGRTPDLAVFKAGARHLILGAAPSSLAAVISITMYRDSVFVRKVPTEFVSASGPAIESADAWMQAISDDGGKWLDCTKARWEPPPAPKHALHDFVNGGCAAVGEHFASMTFVGDSIMRGFYVGFVAAMSGDCLGYGAPCRNLALSGLMWADPKWSQGTPRFLSAEHLKAMEQSGGPPEKCRGTRQLAMDCHKYLRPSVSLCGGALNVSFVWLGQDTPCVGSDLEGGGALTGTSACADMSDAMMSQLTQGHSKSCKEAIAEAGCTHASVAENCKLSCNLCGAHAVSQPPLKGTSACADMSDAMVSKLTQGHSKSCKEAIAEATCNHASVADNCKMSCNLCGAHSGARRSLLAAATNDAVSVARPAWVCACARVCVRMCLCICVSACLCAPAQPCVWVCVVCVPPHPTPSLSPL
jgi:hypothetical protein